VQIREAAVSYPGVGRFRRAETGILGRANKGVLRDSLFYLARTELKESKSKEPAGRPSRSSASGRYGIAAVSVNWMLFFVLLTF